GRPVAGGRARSGRLRVAARLEETAGADVGAALEARIGGCVKDGQRTHLGALGEQAVAADLSEETVEPRGRGGKLDVRRRVAGVGCETADREASGPQTAVQLEGEEQVCQLGLSVGAYPAVMMLGLKV